MTDVPGSLPPEPSPAPSPTTAAPAARPPLWKRFFWPDWKSRKRIMRVEAWAVVIGAYAALALAYLLPQDYRNEAPGYVLLAWLAFLVRVFKFHLGLLLLVIAVAAAFGKGKRLMLAAAPLVLFTLGPVWWSYLAPNASPPAQSSGGRPLRVMSCNLLTINRDFNGILAEIKAADPDVLLLQEYSTPWHKAASAELLQAYPHRSYVTREDAFGLAVYSKLPFVEPVDNRLPLGRVFVEQSRAVVRHEGREVAVYNIHLLPPRTLSYTLEGRLQFADLMETLKAEKLPYVMGGDFNLTNDTQRHADLRAAGARDVHELVGGGRGATWPVNSFFRYLPGIRLDHVYVGPGLRAERTGIGVGRGSDHRPLVADVTWDVPVPAAATQPAAE